MLGTSWGDGGDGPRGAPHSPRCSGDGPGGPGAAGKCNSSLCRSQTILGFHENLAVHPLCTEPRSFACGKQKRCPDPQQGFPHLPAATAEPKQKDISVSGTLHSLSLLPMGRSIPASAFPSSSSLFLLRSVCPVPQIQHASPRMSFWDVEQCSHPLTPPKPCSDPLWCPARAEAHPCAPTFTLDQQHTDEHKNCLEKHRKNMEKSVSVRLSVPASLDTQDI